MNEISWGRICALSALVLALIGLGVGEYKSIEAVKSLKAQVADLRSQVNDASRLAQEESSAANAASLRANEAAVRADAAAAGRRQAEAGQAEAVNSAQQATEAATRANAELERLHREREEELNRMQEALNRVVETHRTPKGMVITLPDSTFRFDFDKADLNQRNRELLSRVAGILLVSKGYGLSVFGYTDDVGTAEYNQQLSLRRAEAVEQYLVQSGIDPAIVNRKGFGKSSPVVAGTSPTARMRNRRVEIALTDSSIKYGDVATASPSK